MHHIHESLLRQQMNSDTIWCVACQMENGGNPAEVRYTVISDDGTFLYEVPACRPHFQRALETANIRITSSTPLEQPTYIAYLENALKAQANS